MDIDRHDNIGKKVYCICSKEDDGNLMIRCDKCKGWFHGACVSVIDEPSGKWYCPNCR